MDFKAYESWNPFIFAIRGKAIPGEKLVVQFRDGDKKGMTFKPKVLAAEVNKEFRWLGHLLIPRLFDGEHKFELVANQDGTTTFIQGEKFGGILVPLLSGMLDNKTRQGFEAMNKKIKELAEASK